MIFRDRADAGRHLATLLERYRPEQPVVLGLVRGGIAVAAEIAGSTIATLAREASPIAEVTLPAASAWTVSSAPSTGTPACVWR